MKCRFVFYSYPKGTTAYVDNIVFVPLVTDDRNGEKPAKPR